MSLWLVRAGKYGEHEAKFFSSDRVYLTWAGGLEGVGLGEVRDYAGIKETLQKIYPDESLKRVVNWSGQVWAFVLGIQPGDWVVVPLKTKAAIAIGEVTGPYQYDPSAPLPYRHFRKIKWLNQEVPRAAFGQDLLYSFGAFMTICKIDRNDAEKRVRAMAKNKWREIGPAAIAVTGAPEDSAETEGKERIDLEQLARDQIALFIQRRFKGHGMSRLVEAILQAQGYTTYVSPAGPDKGVDILASPGTLGFGRPRICVQVKSGDTPVDRPTLDQLIGAMQNVGADQGLLVSWGGFKSSVDRERATQFFRVRLWDAEDLVQELLNQYDSLSADLKAELPLKKIWAVARQEEEG